MTATNTAESKASLQSTSNAVFHSGTLSLEDTEQIINFPELQVAPAENESRTIPRPALATALKLPPNEFVEWNKTETGTCFKNRRISIYIPQGVQSAIPYLSMAPMKWLLLDDSHLPGNDAAWRILTAADFRPVTEIIPAASVSDLPPVVHEFARGVNGRRPSLNVVEVAARVVQSAAKHTNGPYITVDDEDGDLDFHLRLNDNLLVMANLFPDGTIDASVYDDSQGVPVKTVRRMRRSSTSAEELIGLFEQGVGCAGTE